MFSVPVVLSVFYGLPGVSDCCFVIAFFPKLSLQEATCRDDRRQIFLNTETVENIFKHDHCLLKSKYLEELKNPDPSRMEQAIAQ